VHVETRSTLLSSLKRDQRC